MNEGANFKNIFSHKNAQAEHKKDYHFVNIVLLCGKIKISIFELKY
jgi:hypothetical protein